MCIPPMVDRVFRGLKCANQCCSAVFAALPDLISSLDKEEYANMQDWQIWEIVGIALAHPDLNCS
jgi:hypothetical protein